MSLASICDVIILIGALVLAITRIVDFFKNTGKGVKK
jgi:hypothetical protein